MNYDLYVQAYCSKTGYLCNGRHIFEYSAKGSSYHLVRLQFTVWLLPSCTCKKTAGRHPDNGGQLAYLFESKYTTLWSIA